MNHKDLFSPILTSCSYRLCRHSQTSEPVIILFELFVFILSQVVGPPGTGKTDVAVQIISNIYHNFPEQRTLLVTHSNQVKSC